VSHFDAAAADEFPIDLFPIGVGHEGRDDRLEVRR
jgi:hypothetical protein